jgi:hypothetical protein
MDSNWYKSSCYLDRIAWTRQVFQMLAGLSFHIVNSMLCRNFPSLSLRSEGVYDSRL